MRQCCALSAKCEDIADLGGTLLAYILVENAIFNTGYYARIVNPESTTGRLELILWNEQKRPVADSNQVLTIGDSRMGVFPRYANEMKPELGYTFATLAVAGTTPRCWYYMLPVAVWAPLLVGLVAGLETETRPVGWRWAAATACVLGVFFHAGNAQMWSYALVFFGVAVSVLRHSGES